MKSTYLCIQEREDAIEKERSAAHIKLLQEKERHKAQLDCIGERQSTELEKEKRSLNKRIEEQQRQHEDEVQCQQKKFTEDIKRLREEDERSIPKSYQTTIEVTTLS